MAKALINCLISSHARDLRSSLDLAEDAPISNKQVREYLEQRAAFLPTDAARAQISLYRYAERMIDLMAYKRPATLRDVRKGRAPKVGEMFNDPKAGLEAMVSVDKYEMRSGQSLDGKMYAVWSSNMIELRSMITALKPKGGIIRQRKFQDNMVRALFGEKVPPEFQEFAEAFKKFNHKSITRYNNAVGVVPTEDVVRATLGTLDPESFSIPQDVDFKMLDSVSEREFIDDVKKWADLEAMGVMKDGYLDRTPGNQLDKYYQELKTDGMSGYNLDETMSEPSFVKRHRNLRFLRFKDADSWLAFNKKYVKESPFSGMMDHVTTISRETGTREMFGPSPDKTFEQLKHAVMALTGVKTAGNAAERSFKNATAKLSPIHVKGGDVMQTVRNWSTAIHLPGAMLSALPDITFSAATALYNGIPMFRTMKTQLARLKYNSSADQEFAASLGFVMEHAIDSINATGRYADVAGKNISSESANFVMRAGGLNHWTVAMKQGFWETMFMQLGADNTANKAMQNTFKRYGITKADEVAMMASKKINNGKYDFLDPMAVDIKLREKIVAMTHGEMGYAVPEPNSAAQGFLNRGQPRGTVAGEALRGAGQFKAFTTSVLMTHGARILWGNQNNNVSRITYLTGLLVSTSIMGMGVVQLKQLARGNKPLDWDSKELMVQGMLAGGAFTIAGDLILTDATKYGQSLADYLMGPSASDLNSLLFKGLIGNAHDVAAGEKAYGDVVRKYGSEGVDYIPGQFWYLRLALDRGIKENIQTMIDPKWRSRETQREIKRRKEPATNERWWK